MCAAHTAVTETLPTSRHLGEAQRNSQILRRHYQTTRGREQMRHLHARGCTRPFLGLPRLGKRPWKLKASTAAGAHTPPGSAVTAGRAMTAPAPAKRGVAAEARRALRAPPQQFVVSTSRLLLRTSCPVRWLRGAAVRTSSLFGGAPQRRVEVAESPGPPRRLFPYKRGIR